jgi:hypothetical protein
LQRTHQTQPLVPKLMFWGISDRLVAAQTSVQTGRTGAINGQVSATKSRRNFSQRTHPIHPIGPQTHVLGRFGLFRYYTIFGAKWAKLMPLMNKFVQRNRVEIFRNERTRSTLLDAKLIFWGLSDCFVTARTSGPNGCINAEVRAIKLRRNFLQRTHPIHHIGPQTHVWGLSDHFVTAQASLQNGPNCCNKCTS